MLRRHILLASAFLVPSFAQSKKTKLLALQVSDNDPDKMNASLNVAVNVSKEYSEKGIDIDIQIVAFNAGLHMLRDDTSPVKERIASFKQSMPNVAFNACNNTLQAMSKRENKTIAILPNATIVQAGVTTLMDLSDKGYVIVRP